MSQIPEHLEERLTEAAFQETTGFCYSCYVDAPEGRCPRCGTDDLMRHLKGVGVEYGTDWVVTHLLQDNLQAVDTEEAFEESLGEIYGGTTKVGWIEVDTVRAIKELDPISFEVAENDWISAELAEGRLLTPDGSAYYWTHDVEGFLDELGV